MIKNKKETRKFKINFIEHIKVYTLYAIKNFFELVKFKKSFKLYNKTKGKILAKKAKLCKSHISKAIGLMFSRKGKSLVFVFDKEKIVSLHMFFVFYPIDVLFLDKKKKVVEIKKDFKPFRFYTPKNKADYILELPSGIIKKTKTTVGDTISFKKE